jgi:hypothetical protein
VILAETLNGIRNFIADVKWQSLSSTNPDDTLKWHVLDEFEKYYRLARNQYFPKIKAKKNYYYHHVNGASMWM